MLVGQSAIISILLQNCCHGAMRKSSGLELVCQGGEQEDPWYEEGVTVEKNLPQLAPPPMYKVVMLNDDYTPMEFVVEVLESFFGLQREQATRIMLQIHQQGRAAVGCYTRDIAETKAMQVIDFAQQNQHPLLCQVEQA